MKNILIIDDNRDDIEFYSDLINQIDDNYKVYTAIDFLEGISVFENYNIDCTFLDYKLPEMNGLMILEVLRKKNNNKAMPIIILTGENRREIRAESARQGALDFLVKDMNTTTPEQLDAVIKKVIKRANELNN